MISKGNHVKFARFVLLGVSEEAKNDFHFFRSMCNEIVIRFAFVISEIIEVSVMVISLCLRLRLITHTFSSTILDITKTSSNNCL